MSQPLASENSSVQTTPAQKLPNFLIIGAAKSGTTSIYHYLKNHPDIFMSKIKETNFFLGDGRTAMKEIGLDGKTRELSSVGTLAEYSALFQAATEKARGEASPKYLYYPGTAERIKAAVPNAKIIAVLRHPVDRAYSAFLHHVRENQEEYTDFAAALEAEPERIERGIDPKYHYRNRGLYFKQLKPYYDAFGAENVHVYLYEELRDPLGLLRPLFGVLGVDPSFTPDVSAQHNISGVPKNRFLHSVYGFLKGNGHNAVKNLGKRLLPTTFRQRLKGRAIRNLQKNNLSKPPLAPEVRADLLKGYKEDITRLQDLIGRDLTHWLE